MILCSKCGILHVKQSFCRASIVLHRSLVTTISRTVAAQTRTEWSSLITHDPLWSNTNFHNIIQGMHRQRHTLRNRAVVGHAIPGLPASTVKLRARRAEINRQLLFRAVFRNAQYHPRTVSIIEYCIPLPRRLPWCYIAF
jgi:hypothetical protein